MGTRTRTRGAWLFCGALCNLLVVGCGRLGYDLATDRGGDTSAPDAGGGSGNAAGGAGGALGGAGGALTTAGGAGGGGAGGALTSTGGAGGTGSVDGGSGAAGTGGRTQTDAATTDGAMPLPPPALSTACGFGTLTVIEDGNAGDDATGATLAAAIRDACGTTPTMRTVSQDAPGVLDPTSGRPLLGPAELAVSAGGPSAAQRVIRYLNISDTPLFLNTSQPGTFEIDERGTGRVVVSVRSSTLGTAHDFALLMIVFEPISKTTLVSTYARGTPGTSVGAFWFASGAAGPITSDTHHWYVIEWTNVDATFGPSAGDTFVLVASG